MSAERLELGFVTHRRGEFGGDQDPSAERLAKLLDPLHLVDRRTDDGEVEAVYSANISVQYFAEVEREIDEGDGLSHPRAIGVEPVEGLHRFGCGVERMAAGFCACRIDEGEAREHAVSHELEHLAAMPAQRRCQRLEYVVE